MGEARGVWFYFLISLVVFEEELYEVHLILL